MGKLDDVNRVLEEIGERYGLQAQLDGEGTLALRLESGPEVYFEWNSEREQLYLFAPLLTVPEAGELQTALFRRLLELNCLGVGTGDGTLSLYRPLDAVIFHRTIAVPGLTADRLEADFDQFLALLQTILLDLEGNGERIRKADTGDTDSHPSFHGSVIRP